MQTTTIRFLKNHGPYIASNVATFPVDMANQLMTNGAAELYVPRDATKDANKPVFKTPLPKRTPAGKSITKK